ncbi:hypothetical protein V1477_014804, partial [Vespula maculifrons]
TFLTFSKPVLAYRSSPVIASYTRALYAFPKIIRNPVSSEALKRDLRILLTVAWQRVGRKQNHWNNASRGPCSPGYSRSGGEKMRQTAKGKTRIERSLSSAIEKDKMI